jgi:hypothetical protein
MTLPRRSRPQLWMPSAPMLNFKKYSVLSGIRAGPSIEGWWTLELIHKESGLIAERRHFRNLITDAGMDAMASVSIPTSLTNFAVGTGSTAPAVEDSTLETELARTNSNGGFSDVNGIFTGNAYHFFRRTRVFTTSQANGNLTEVGALDAAAAGTLFSRQLIQDAEGAPTTLVKTSDFELRVVYEVRVYPDLDDRVYSATIDGSPQNVTTRPIDIDSINWRGGGSFTGILGRCGFSVSLGGTAYSGAIGPATGVPTGSLGFSTVRTPAAYSPGAFEQDVEVEWGAAVGNGEVLSFQFAQGDFAYQHQLTGAVTKDNTQRMTIELTKTWARHTP